MSKSGRLILSCEHAANRVPAPFARRIPAAVLRTHRGFDPGALELARGFSRALKTPLFASRVSRLVVDCNRSEDNRKSLFSPYTQSLAPAEKEQVLARYYRPYRNAILRRLRAQTGGRGKVRVFHLSVHSFTPVLRGRKRKLDLGMLFDPRRPAEKSFCRRWKAALERRMPRLKVRFNAPYRGMADGCTTALRAFFFPVHYLGIELEINQKWPLGPRAPWRALQRNLIESLKEIINENARS